jgi:hypothetical protein
MTRIKLTADIIDFLKFHYEDEHYGISKTNNDKFFIFTGLTGSGKSNTVLHFFHYWYKDILKKGEDVEYFNKFFAGRIDGFASALKEAKNQKYTMIVHDEVILDLHSKDGQKSLSKKLFQTYNVIRGKNLFTIVLLPNLCDFSKDFVKERVQHWIHCYKEDGHHYAAYYSPSKVSNMVPKMFKMQEQLKRGSGEDRPDPLSMNIQPSMLFKVKRYTGIYASHYEMLKQENMDATIDDLYDLVHKGKIESVDIKKYKKLKLIKRIIDLMSVGKTHKEIAVDVEMSVNSLRTFISRENLNRLYKNSYEKNRGVS